MTPNEPNRRVVTDIACANATNLFALRRALERDLSGTCAEYGLEVGLANKLLSLDEADIKRIAYEADKRVFTLNLSTVELDTILEKPAGTGSIFLAVCKAPAPGDVRRKPAATSLAA